MKIPVVIITRDARSIVLLDRLQKLTSAGVDACIVSDILPDFTKLNADDSVLYESLIKNKIFHYSNEEMFNLGFTSCTNRSDNVYNVTAWEKALYHSCKSNFKHVWLIEDDVYWNNEHLLAKMLETESDADLIAYQLADNIEANPTWHWWDNTVFPTSEKKCWSATLNQVCRLSSKLLEHVRQYAESHKRLFFHEVMFATTCKIHNYKISFYTEMASEMKVVVKTRSPIFKAFAQKEVEDLVREHKSILIHPVKHSVNKTLVCILSETRAHEITYQKFKENFLNRYEADLCLCVAKNEREELDNPFYKAANYVFQYPEPIDWGDAFDKEAKGKEWRRFLKFIDWPKANASSNWLGGIYKDGVRIPASGGILLFFRWFLKTQIIKNNLHNTYDRFVITRSDYLYECPAIPPDILDSNYIWLPSSDDWDGYTDKHLVCSASHILDVLGVADGLVNNSDLLYKALDEHSKSVSNMNLESFLKFAFHLAGLESKIKRYPFTMFAVRAKEGHTSWNKGTYYPELGYNVKRAKLYNHAKLAEKIYTKYGHWTQDAIDELEQEIIDNKLT